MKNWVIALKNYLFIFRDRGREGEREGQKHLCVVAPRTPPTAHLACNPGMCPSWQWNRQSFASQFSAQSTEPYQPRQLEHFFLTICSLAFCCTTRNLISLSSSSSLPLPYIKLKMSESIIQNIIKIHFKVFKFTFTKHF